MALNVDRKRAGLAFPRYDADGNLIEESTEAIPGSSGASDFGAAQGIQMTKGLASAGANIAKAADAGGPAPVAPAAGPQLRAIEDPEARKAAAGQALAQVNEARKQKMRQKKQTEADATAGAIGGVGTALSVVPVVGPVLGALAGIGALIAREAMRPKK